MEAMQARFRERARRDLEVLRRHLAADDLGGEMVETTAHKLAGSAALFGFPGIGEAAREIDRALSTGDRPGRDMLETLIARLAAAASPGPQPAAASAAEAAGSPAGGGETILVVEDDDLLRAHAERALQGFGYQVLCAAGADDLLARLDTLPPIQLLFTDLMLPGAADGEALAREIRRRRPQVRVLFTSGRSPREPAGETAPPFLPKPYRRDALAAMVRRILNQPADEAGARPTDASTLESEEP